jgi:hypothetical protein
MNGCPLHPHRFPFKTFLADGDASTFLDDKPGGGLIILVGKIDGTGSVVWDIIRLPQLGS